MKKIILSLVVLSVFYMTAYSQEKRINLYGAYVFDDQVSAYDSYNYGYGGKIKGGFQYGAGFEFLPHEEMGVELLWIGQTTKGQLNYYNKYNYGGKPLSIDLNLNYAMLGFNRYGQTPGSSVETFAGLMVGCLFASGKYSDANLGSYSASKEKFAWGMRFGANIGTSDRLVLKIQAQLLSAVQAVGGSLYFGTGGASAGVSTYSSMLQFSIGGGLAFKMGN